MTVMILKMTTVTMLYVILTVLLWKCIQGKKLSAGGKAGIGLVYGICSILSTHFGVDYGHMLLNVRDMGPLAAGLFFDPAAGVIAGVIGGVERYLAGTYWGVGSYTRIACSVSTCLAGFVAAAMHFFIFKRKRPSAVYAFFMGAVMEVFHMYVVFITHREDMNLAFYVVRTCAPPMIVFTGLGMAAASTALEVCVGEWKKPFRRMKGEEIPVSQQFEFWLFVVTALSLVLNLLFSYGLQTQTAVQKAGSRLSMISGDILETYSRLQQAERKQEGRNFTDISELLPYFHVGTEGTFDIIPGRGAISAGTHQGKTLSLTESRRVAEHPPETSFREKLFGVDSLCLYQRLEGERILLVTLPMSEVYAERDAQTYESAFAAILLFAAIFGLVSILVQNTVVQNLERVTESLGRIAHGSLDEAVQVRSSSEFASLSDDINKTVDALKGYIDAAEKRMEQELELARTIQEAALPKNFHFPRGDFDLYAMMDPAKEVGGDFYDFFFVGPDRMALVIADVSGKGIPAALIMMRAKTAIRSRAESGESPAEILCRANDMLCEGNDAEMFVTVWLGIIDLLTGRMRCVNAGHEYPVVMRTGEDYAYVKEKHGLALAAMEGMRYKEYVLQLNPGDRLFVYTDGAPEAINRSQEAYGPERLIQALNMRKGENMATLLPAVREDIAAFVGEENQFDDITMLGFVYHGKKI